MSERIKLAVIFSYNEQWMGGSYYVINLIESLKNIDDSLRPFLFIIVSSELERKMIEDLNYPHNEIIIDSNSGFTFFQRVFNFIAKKTLQRHIFKSYSYLKDCKIIFPVFGSHLRFNMKPYYWIPDFQELHYPSFFSSKEIIRRVSHHKKIASQNCTVIFSSYNACNDFNRFYPNNICSKHVLHFAVTHPKYSHLNIGKILEKYNLPTEYFILPNQFWKHKNHITVLKAAILLKSKLNGFCIALTGKENDNRNPLYASELKEFVREHNLFSEIRFLGFIDRTEQLLLMSKSIAVIQPSLFEGWSTVIEDAKAMNKYVIASSIEVNKEQINENVSFFDPLNPEQLSNILIDCIHSKFSNKKELDYSRNISIFGNQFVNLIN